MTQRQITIYGAGISGIVAAINLAREGFTVEVIEKRNQIGGSPRWHPSVHQQTFNLKKTSEYIDIDVSSCFNSVKRHTFYYYGRKSVVDMPNNSYVCEKGQRSFSIENFLYSEAKRYGVKFVFGETLDPKAINLKRAYGYKCIVATGLEIELYKTLDIKHTIVQGFRSSRTVDNGGLAISYFGDYTNHDFAYVASSGDLMFSLLFARRGVNEQSLQAFNKHLLESEGIAFDDWQYSTGCVPLETNLVKNDVVLAGTISGMIDPFYLNGISAALISGKVAAQFFIDAEMAIYQFKQFTGNFYLKRYLKSVSMRMPFKRFSFPLFPLINSHLKWVGVI